MRRDRYTDGKTRKGCGENPRGKVSLFIKKKKKRYRSWESSKTTVQGTEAETEKYREQTRFSGGFRIHSSIAEHEAFKNTALTLV